MCDEKKCCSGCGKPLDKCECKPEKEESCSCCKP